MRRVTFQEVLRQKVKKTVSFKEEPEVEIFDTGTGKTTQKVVKKTRKVVRVRRVRQTLRSLQFSRLEKRILVHIFSALLRVSSFH